MLQIKELPCKMNAPRFNLLFIFIVTHSHVIGDKNRTRFSMMNAVGDFSTLLCRSQHSAPNKLLNAFYSSLTQLHSVCVYALVLTSPPKCVLHNISCRINCTQAAAHLNVQLLLRFFFSNSIVAHLEMKRDGILRIKTLFFS